MLGSFDEGHDDPGTRPLRGRRPLPLLRQIQALHVAAHPETFRSDLDADAPAASLRAWSGRGGVTAIAAREGGGAVVGHAICEVREREAGMLTTARRHGVLHHLAVEEARRRRGVGTRPVEVKRRLRAAGVRRIQAEHLAGNDAPAALMRDAGLLPRSVIVEGPT